MREDVSMHVCGVSVYVLCLVSMPQLEEARVRSGSPWQCSGFPSLSLYTQWWSCTCSLGARRKETVRGRFAPEVEKKLSSLYFLFVFYFTTLLRYVRFRDVFVMFRDVL